MSGTQNVQQPGRRFQGDPLLSDQDIQDGRAYLFRWYPTLVLAIEAAARADALAEVRRGVEGLTGWRLATDGISGWMTDTWTASEDGPFLDRAAVLALLADPPN